jgi:hypothetical protein
MSEMTCRPLIAVLAEVPDFRKSQGRRYSLASILALACAATLCGYKSYGAMSEWSQHYGSDFAQRLGFPTGKTPSVGTLHTIFRFLDKQALERVLSHWAETVLAQVPPGKSRRIALDGKTLRGSARQGALDVHLLSAVSHGLGLTVGQEAVDDKTNEIGAVEALLDALVIEGRIFTMDALLTQKKIAQAIVEKKGTT